MHISDGSADVCSSELGSYRLDWIAALFDSLHQWCHADARTAPFEHDKLPNLTRDTLLLRTSKAGAGRTPESPICDAVPAYLDRSEEHTSELQSLMRNSYAVFCLKKKKYHYHND